jgi:hypothetical protein
VTVEDRIVLKSQCAHPITFEQIILPLIRLLYNVATAIRQSIYSPELQEGVASLQKLVTEFFALRKEAALAVTSNFCSNVLTNELNRLADMILAAKNELLPKKQLVAPRRPDAKFGLSHPWYTAKFTPLVPPGSTVTHDNDFNDISKISILPTMDEMMCTSAPILPGNYQHVAEAHWLPLGPERLIDTHFRLLRQDLIGAIKDNVAGYLSYLASPNEFKNVQSKRTRFRADWKKSSSPMPSETGQIDLFVYKDVTFTGIKVMPKSGLCLEVHFEYNEDNIRDDRLMFGGMVTFLLKGPNDYQIIFGTIVDKKSLTKKPKSNILVKIPIAFLKVDLLRLMLKSTDAKDERSPHLLIETNQVMFEAYRPILESLQMVPSF